MNEASLISPATAPANIEAARQIVDLKRATPFFQRRYRRNVIDRPQEFCREDFWKQMVVCMCTSVQASGPKSRLSAFVREKPFPLSLKECEGNADLRTGAGAILSSRGLRFGPKIAAQIDSNLAALTSGMWDTIADQFIALARLPA